MSHDPRIDELRQRLRALGYLDTGVDRFVLGPARSTRLPLTFTLLASARVGVLAALLLGPAATIGLGARVPGLITNTRDAIIVASYLGIAFGMAMTIAALLTATTVALAVRVSPSILPRYGTALSRTAGASIAIACLAYLTVWWQAVIADVRWSAPAWTLSALAIAVAISLLLGHAVSVVSSAIVIARSDGNTSAPKRSWRSAVLTGAVAFGGAALLLTWLGHAASSATSPVLTVVPSGVRLKVVAIDGFDPQIFNELSTAGRMPALTEAFGGAVVDLAADLDLAFDPARVWTTIATGQPMSRHGVRGLETRRVPGVGGAVPIADPSGPWSALAKVTDILRFTRPAIVSGTERRAKMYWEVAAEAGLRTAVVNWWVTWPADSSDGIVLSDRATLRLERGGELNAEIAPASLYPDLRQRWPSIAARAERTADEAFSDLADRSTSAALRRSAHLDALQLALLEEVTTPRTDLEVVYLPGLDVAQYAVLAEQSSIAAPSTLSRQLAMVKQYYEVLDHLLDRKAVLKPASDQVVIVLTQTGRIGVHESGRFAVRGLHASAIREGVAPLTAVAPTLLYALGLPLARDLASTPVVALFSSAFTSRYPMRFVDTYGASQRNRVQRTGAPLDQEMIERLRSLGYVR